MITIMQGDSRPIFMGLTVNNTILTPDMISNLEIYIGEELRLTFKEDSVKYDSTGMRWYIWPTQEQTFSLEPGVYIPQMRIKFRNDNTTNVKGFYLDEKIKVKAADSQEVL